MLFFMWEIDQSSQSSCIVSTRINAFEMLRYVLLCVPTVDGFTKKTFLWEKYLQVCRASAAPCQLFKVSLGY